MKDIKSIEKKIKLLESLKKIDSDIIKLDKLANMVNEGRQPSFKLSVKKPEVEKKETKETEQYYIPLSFSWSPSAVSVPPVYDKESFESEINDKFTYVILDIIIKEKNIERERLIKALTA